MSQQYENKWMVGKKHLQLVYSPVATVKRRESRHLRCSDDALFSRMHVSSCCGRPHVCVWHVSLWRLCLEQDVRCWGNSEDFLSPCHISDPLGNWLRKRHQMSISVLNRSWMQHLLIFKKSTCISWKSPILDLSHSALSELGAWYRNISQKY